MAGEQGDGTAGLRCDDVERGKKEPVRVVREPEATLARSRVRPFEQGICLYGAFACQALFNARECSGPFNIKRAEGEPALVRGNVALRPCIRLDPRWIQTMKQSFASAARLRGGKDPFSTSA